jgi:hypothetical protein
MDFTKIIVIFMEIVSISCSVNLRFFAAVSPTPPAMIRKITTAENHHIVILP